MLILKNLNVAVENTLILKDLNLKINPGEIHAIMGPNGSGKSTLSSVLCGKESYKVVNGKILFKNIDLTFLRPEERACMGLFLAFQYPVEIPGVSNKNFLHNSINSVRKYNNKKLLDQFDILDLIISKIKLLNVPIDLLTRFVNVGFSGGEKKINDILQMLLLNPDLCILDEIDSGLDIDALKIISSVINSLRNSNRSFIVITHYQRILNFIKPNYVHILYKGSIIKSGNFSLVKQLEEQGYGWISK